MHTFPQLLQYLLQSSAVFNLHSTVGHRPIEHEVFALLMRHLALVNRQHSFRTDVRTSFVLTRTIGVILNGGSLGEQLPSRLLKVEKLLVKAIEVSYFSILIH